MKIYTKTGDDGTTGLFGGDRVPKDSLRIEAYGTVDELNSFVGLVVAALPASGSKLEDTLLSIQYDLFVAGADLATPLSAKPVVPRISDVEIEALENHIDRLESDLEPLKTFILPGGALASAHAQVARTVCRRAERCCVTLAANDEINSLVTIYLNRLSDLLFVISRWINLKSGKSDIPWIPRE